MNGMLPTTVSNKIFNNIKIFTLPETPCRNILAYKEQEITEPIMSPTTGTKPIIGSSPKVMVVPGILNLVSNQSETVCIFFK